MNSCSASVYRSIHAVLLKAVLSWRYEIIVHGSYLLFGVWAVLLSQRKSPFVSSEFEQAVKISSIRILQITTLSRNTNH